MTLNYYIENPYIKMISKQQFIILTENQYVPPSMSLHHPIGAQI